MFKQISLAQILEKTIIGYNDCKDGLVLAFQNQEYIYLEGSTDNVTEEGFVSEKSLEIANVLDAVELVELFKLSKEQVELYNQQRKDKLALYYQLQKELGL